MDLNEEQLAAVTHPSGEAALLLAGAGSGKTAVLTARVSWLIKQGVAPRRILGLTFTNKAANEIKERVLAATGLPEEQAPRLSTIHSLALALIRRNPQGFDLGNRVSPLDEYHQGDLMKRIVERGEFDLNFRTVLEQIEFHRARGVGFSPDYTEEVHRRAMHQHAGYHAMGKDELQVWKLFEEEKKKAGLLDFSDMLWTVLHRMEHDQEWLGKLQKMFDHVLVDECQDSNIPQHQVFTGLLGPENRNLYLTGDVAQSIFGFNGSAPFLLTEYAEGWRGKAPLIYTIVRNHRSVPQVVSFANRIRAKMTNVSNLEMESFRGVNGERGKMRLVTGDTPVDIARAVASEIVSGGRPYRDYCLLVRSSIQIRDIEGALVQARIPYVVRGGSGLLQTEEVRDVLSYLRLAINPKDFSAFARAVSTPRRGIGDVAMENLRRTAHVSHDGDLLAAAEATGDKFRNFAMVLRGIQQHLETPSHALSAAVGRATYIEHLRKRYAKDLDKVKYKTENLQRLKLMMEGLETGTGMTTEDIIFQLTMERTAEDAGELGSVTISTIHMGKGLEWPVVWVMNMVDGQLPHWRSLASSNDDVGEEVEEERRLFYVAVTRARDECVLGVPSTFPRGESLIRVEPSRFLAELGVS